MYFFLRFLVLKIYLNIPKFELCLSHCLKVTVDEVKIDFKTTKSTKKKCTCLRISVNMGTGYESSDFHRSFLMLLKWSNHTQTRSKNVSQY